VRITLTLLLLGLSPLAVSLSNAQAAAAAFDLTHKLYRDGRLFELKVDPLERRPIPPDAVPGARKKLQAAMDLYRDARPAELQRPSPKAASEGESPKEKKKANK